MIELGVLDSQSRWAVDGLQRVEAQPILTASWRLPDTRTLPRYDPGERSGSDLHAREASMGTTDNFFLSQPDRELEIAFETRSEGQGELPRYRFGVVGYGSAGGVLGCGGSARFSLVCS